MLKNRFIIIALVAVLAIIAFIVSQDPQEQVRDQKINEMMFDIDSSAVTRLDIGSGDEAITIEYISGQWMITKPFNYKAATFMVNNSISMLAGMKKLELASNNPERAKRFNLDSGAVPVIVYQGAEPVAEMEIGKPGKDFGETYVKARGADDVWKVSGAMAYLFRTTPGRWRDRTVNDFTTDEIDKLTINYKGDEFTLERRDSLWFIGDKQADMERASGAIKTFAGLSTDQIVDSLLTKDQQLTGTLSYGGITLSLYEQEGLRKYLMRRSDNDLWFEINQMKAEAMLAPRSSFLAE